MVTRKRTAMGRRRTYEHNIQLVRKRNAEYAAALADPKGRFKPNASAATSKSSIKNYLNRPADNAENISATLRRALVSSGVINRVLDYYQSHPTYNHSVYPVLGNKQYDVTPDLRRDYIDIAYGLNQLNIHFFAPYFFKETLVDGVAYFYKIQDASGVGYIKLPGEWCRISSLENGVYRYRLDVSKLKAEVYDALPKELQQAFDDYQKNSGTDNTDKWYDNKWFYVSSKGMAFTFDQNSLVNGGVAISPFASILADSISLEQAKDNIEIKDQLDTIRLIHSKIPVNSDGMPTLDLKTAKNFDAAMRNRLPEGVVAVSSPSNLTNVSLKGSGTEGVYDTVDKGVEQLFYDFGTSAPLFGGKTTSANIVKESVRKDANWIFTNLFPLLENYYNFELSQIKTSTKIPWNIKFVRQSNFTLKEDISNCKDQLSFGGSRLDYLAACGFSPVEVVSKLGFEQEALDIDSLMVVKPTSNTLSSSAAAAGKTNNQLAKGGVGRPKTDNPSDDTDRLDGEQ